MENGHAKRFDDITHRPFLYPQKEKPFIIMGEEMDELRSCFEKLETKVEAGQEKIRAEIQMINDAVKKVRTHIVGDTDFASKGLAERLKDVEDQVKTYDKIYYKALGVASIVGFLWTLAITILFKFWDKIF